MGRQRGRIVHGIAVLDKPAGLSSNRALQQVRRTLDARKAGHTGTLDPFATGMLVLCFGDATKFSSYLLDSDKTYLAELRLGESTTTGDTEGEVTAQTAIPALSEPVVASTLHSFLGDSEQIPPMYSALKHKGQRLYDLARRGEVVERPPRRIAISTIELVRLTDVTVTIRVRCSKGTYIRVLCEDIARSLGTVGHCSALRRESLGPFSADQMMTQAELESAADPEALLMPVDAGIGHVARYELDKPASIDLQQGRTVRVDAADVPLVRAYREEELLGLCTIENGVLQAVRLCATGD